MRPCACSTSRGASTYDSAYSCERAPSSPAQQETLVLLALFTCPFLLKIFVMQSMGAFATATQCALAKFPPKASSGALQAKQTAHSLTSGTAAPTPAVPFQEQAAVLVHLMSASLCMAPQWVTLSAPTPPSTATTPARAGAQPSTAWSIMVRLPCISQQMLPTNAYSLAMWQQL